MAQEILLARPSEKFEYSSGVLRRKSLRYELQMYVDVMNAGGSLTRKEIESMRKAYLSLI